MGGHFLGNAMSLKNRVGSTKPFKHKKARCFFNRELPRDHNAVTETLDAEIDNCLHHHSICSDSKVTGFDSRNFTKQIKRCVSYLDELRLLLPLIMIIHIPNHI